MKFKKLMIMLITLVISTMLLVACEPNTEVNTENNGDSESNPEIKGETLWKLDDTTLIISGSGPMKDYLFQSYRPWDSKSFRIEKVVIEDGITHIGVNSFYNCQKLESIIIPNSVTSIGDAAFQCCDNLTSVIIPDGVTSIE